MGFSSRIQSRGKASRAYQVHDLSLLLNLVHPADDSVGAASFGREIDLYGGSLGKGQIGCLGYVMAGKKEKISNNVDEMLFHDRPHN
jgi:hypothetical protein